MKIDISKLTLTKRPKTQRRKARAIIAYGYGGRDIDGVCTTLVHPQCREAYVATFGSYPLSLGSIYHEDEAGYRPRFEATCPVCKQPIK